MSISEGTVGESKWMLLEKMKLIRETELEISRRYHEGMMRCPTHLSVGQEAVAAALSQCCLKDDYAVSTHRGHAHYLGKGGCIHRLIAEIYGKKTGCSGGRGGSMHLIDLNVNFMGTSAIVGNSIPIGVGLGLSARLDKNKQVSYIFMGDGAIEEGAFYESANFACVKKLPVIFVCENNLYSVYTTLKERQPEDRRIYKLARSIGILKSIKEDGNDAIKANEALMEATAYTRETGLPSFIEFETYRWLEHCGPNNDDSLGYRAKDEVEKWTLQDPISRLERDLIKNDSDNERKDYMCKNIQALISKAFDMAEEAPWPEQPIGESCVYAEGQNNE